MYEQMGSTEIQVQRVPSIRNARNSAESIKNHGGIIICIIRFRISFKDSFDTAC